MEPRTKYTSDVIFECITSANDEKLNLLLKKMGNTKLEYLGKILCN